MERGGATAPGPTSSQRSPPRISYWAVGLTNISQSPMKAPSPVWGAAVAIQLRDIPLAAIHSGRPPLS